MLINNIETTMKNIGTIKSSNLCVAPQTLVLTSKGQQNIEDLKCVKKRLTVKN